MIAGFEEHPQGLKPTRFIGLIGTTEVKIIHLTKVGALPNDTR
jgi:hypothetical protein